MSHLTRERQKRGQKHESPPEGSKHAQLICRSEKPATWQQMLIVNDLSGNKIGNTPATDRQHFAGFSQVPAFRLAVFQNFSL
jgi:hypothetical protein